MSEEDEIEEEEAEEVKQVKVVKKEQSALSQDGISKAAEELYKDIDKLCDSIYED